jgi:hypothetical protein
MKEKIKVVMLPTEDKTNIKLDSDGVRLWYDSTPISTEIHTHQYVYITVSKDIEPIKEGDWCVFGFNLKEDLGEQFKNDPVEFSLLQCTGYCENGYLLHEEGNTSKKHCRKIIATTDPKLFKTAASNYTRDKGVWGCDRIQQSFLKEFVANPDREFEVEYEEGTCKCLTCNKTIASTCEYTYKCNIQIIKKLKLNQDNEVNITSVEKKMYSKKGLLNKLSLISLRLKFHSQSGMFINKQTSYEIINWIEENL